ncbi:hypothetical protein LINPERPRIM_LOCUS17209, partial [Linum perenne]
FVAIACLIFARVVIFLATTTWITLVVVRPKIPAFDVQNACLNGIYFDSDEFFDGDVSYITNFTNPNKKMDVRFEYVGIKFYFGNKLLGAQAIQPFTQRPGEIAFSTVNFKWSLAYLSRSSAV